MAKKQYVYFYFMKENPEKIGEFIGKHIDYWQDLNLPKYIGGPFDDKSGALITFEAESIEKATDLIGEDPFAKEDLLEEKWLKEWLVD